MADKVGVYDITGGFLADPSVLPVSGSDAESVNTKNVVERKHYTQVLLGEFSTGSECPPSWTQFFAGKKHAFVIPTLSSSDDFSMRLNTYQSGS